GELAVLQGGAMGLPGLSLRRGRREDEFVPLYFDGRERHRTTTSVEELARERAALLADLEPEDGVAVGARTGEVPAAEEALAGRLCRAGTDQRDGHAEGSKDAHARHDSG